MASVMSEGSGCVRSRPSCSRRRESDGVELPSSSSGCRGFASARGMDVPGLGAAPGESGLDATLEVLVVLVELERFCGGFRVRGATGCDELQQAVHGVFVA